MGQVQYYPKGGFAKPRARPPFFMDFSEILYIQSYAYQNRFCLLLRAILGEGHYYERETFSYTSKRVGAELDVQISPLFLLECLIISFEGMIDSYFCINTLPDIYQNK